MIKVGPPEADRDREKEDGASSKAGGADEHVSHVEQRRQPRLETNLPVTFSGEQVRGAGVVLNLSEQGCLIESDVQPAQGSYLHLTLTLPDQRPPLRVECASVRWVAGRRFGLRFLYVTLDVRELLVRFLESLRPHDPPAATGSPLPR